MWWKAILLILSFVVLAPSTASFVGERTLHVNYVTIPSVIATVRNDDSHPKEVTIPVPVVHEDDNEPKIINDDDENDTEPPVEATTEENSKEQTETTSEESPSESPEPPDDDSISGPEDIVEEPETVEIETPVVIETKYGRVRGFYKHSPLRILSFIDIPYGVVGSRLFLPPTEPNSWEGILQNREHRVHCLQTARVNEQSLATQETIRETQVGTIECLALSVFIPENAENAKVLFHIHDGDFEYGSGDPSRYGPEHLVGNNVILVLPNYRLGLLGFLCLQNDIVPGNAGLKDLTFALNWTKENIANFGGDPSNIVVSGLGSAGALASYLAISPLSNDYISKVIIDSGSMFAHWAIDRDPLATAGVITEIIGNKTSEFTLNEFEEILTKAEGITFKPCVETRNASDIFLGASPWTILQDNTTEIKTTFMIGSADLPGSHEALSYSEESLAEINTNFSKFLPNDLYFRNENEMLEVANRVREHYFGVSEVNSETIMELAKCYTDVSYLTPLIHSARALLERGATVYLYEFSFVGTFNRERVALESQLNGAARGDVIGYVFTQEGQLPEAESRERQVLDHIVKLWLSFIEAGKPEVDGTEWPELENVTDTEEQWLSINTELALKTGFHVERMRLWREIYEEHFIEINLAPRFLIQNHIIFLSVFISVLFKNVNNILK